MKYLFFLIYTITFISCYNVDFEEGQVTKMEHFLINSETFKPIEGIKVYLVRKSDIEFRQTIIDSAWSDKKGYYSFDVFSISENRDYYTTIKTNLYTRDRGYDISKKYYLAPLSWLKIQVKNINPIDKEDKIEFFHYPYAKQVNLIGTAIDSTYILPISYDYGYERSLTYTTTKNGISTFKSIPITMKSFDTTFVKIVY